MVLDADKYRLSKPAIIGLMYDKKTDEERTKFIGAAALATNVPIIIVCVYVGETYGFNNSLTNFMSELLLFYRVTEVLNIKKGSS